MKLALGETKLICLDSAFLSPLCQVLMGSKKEKSEMQRKLHFSLTQEPGDFVPLCNVAISADARAWASWESVWDEAN
jgi:hypothetical protein